MKKQYIVRFCVIALAIGLILAGCDFFELSGKSDADPDPLVLTGTSDGKALTIIISQGNSSRTVLTPKSGDNYEIQLDNVLVSKGTLSISGSAWTFNPSSGSPNTSKANAVFSNGTLSSLTIPGTTISNAQAGTNGTPSGVNNNGDNNNDDGYPVLTGSVTINKTSPKVGDILTASYSGNGTGTATWQWLRDGVLISNAVSSTYTVTAADFDKPLRARVSYANQTGSVTSAATAKVAVGQSTPQGTVAAPTASPAGGIYTSTQSVTLSTTTDGASIYYTINGSVPTTSSTQYTNTITITQTTILKAIAVKTGMDNSEDFSANYYIYEGSSLPLGNGMSIKDVNDNGGVVVEMIAPLSINNAYDAYDLIPEITKKVYTVFKDDFDSIFVILDKGKDIVNKVGFWGTNFSVSNNVSGIGTNIYSNSDRYGSGDKLNSVMLFPTIENAIAFGPTLHEYAHNWAAYICPTFAIEVNENGEFIEQIPYSGHWGVSNAGGQLGGFKYVQVIEENSGGVTGKTKYQGSMDPSFQRGFGEFANGGNGLPYSDIELYLMGMKSAAELRTDGFRLDVYTGLSFDDAESYYFDGYFYATDITSYSIDNLIALNGNGPRVPDAESSQKKFRVLTVLVSENGSAEADYQGLVNDIKWFANMPGYENKYQDLYNFSQATGGVGSLEVTGIKDSLK